MEDTLISFVTAKLAKEKGFDLEVAAIPTQSLLQKWLREKHNISVEINTGYIKGEHVFSAVVWNGYLDKEIIHVNSTTVGDFFTYEYEDALEEGLIEALKLIENE